MRSKGETGRYVETKARASREYLHKRLVESSDGHKTTKWWLVHLCFSKVHELQISDCFQSKPQMSSQLHAQRQLTGLPFKMAAAEAGGGKGREAVGAEGGGGAGYGDKENERGSLLNHTHTQIIGFKQFGFPSLDERGSK